MSVTIPLNNKNDKTFNAPNNKNVITFMLRDNKLIINTYILFVCLAICVFNGITLG